MCKLQVNLIRKAWQELLECLSEMEVKKTLYLDEGLFIVSQPALMWTSSLRFRTWVYILRTNSGAIPWTCLLWIPNSFLFFFFFFWEIFIMLQLCPFLWRFPKPFLSPQPLLLFFRPVLIPLWRKLAKEKWVSLPFKAAYFSISLYRMVIVSKPEITINEYVKNTG